MGLLLRVPINNNGKPRDATDFADVTLEEAQVARSIEHLMPFSSFDFTLNNAMTRQDLVQALLSGEWVYVGDLKVQMRHSPAKKEDGNA